MKAPQAIEMQNGCGMAPQPFSGLGPGVAWEAALGAARLTISTRRLTTDQKIEILRRWEYDAVELGVATEEGMSNHTADVLPQIVAALTELGAEINTDRTPPTKQGGFDKVSVKRRT